MRQVVQDLRTGEIRLADVPPPAMRAGFVRVATAASVVSPGTERALVTLGRRSLLGKARARPDLVARVLKKMRRDGLVATVRTVRDRLAAPLPLGYSAAGTVLDASGSGGALVPGDRVACAGASFANHAEEIAVPRNLVARVPDGVSLEEAACGTLGAIALNAVRATGATLGERVGVVGTGVLGTLALRIARAAGLRALAVDTDPAALSRARASGAEVVASPDDAASAAKAWTNRQGLDSVIVAAASEDSAPLALAADLLRRAGTVVLLGDVPLSVPRRLAYAKEATVRVATSYGPGRYDRSYEEGGRDYPLAYVRWTAGRNLAAFLALLASRSVRVDDLLEPVEFGDALSAYERLLAGDTGGKAFLLRYPAPTPKPAAAPVRGPKPGEKPAGSLRAALVGAGNFARGVLWPALAGAGLSPSVLVSASGPTAAEAAKRLGFARATTDADEACASGDLDVVVIATPHDSHARLSAAALAAGKHVFVEKPLAIDEKGLAAVEEALAGARGLLAVGFNRRWSPAALNVKAFLDPVPGPSLVVYRVNAGEVADGSWVGDARVSGGRIVGEACHMVDLAAFLCGERPVRIAAAAARGADDSAGRDDVVLTVQFSGGSVATIAYHAMGDPALPKERVEIVRGDRAAAIDDFRAVTLSRGGKTSRTKTPPDKGHAAEASAFVTAVKAGGPPPIPYEDLLAVTRATLRARTALGSGRFEDV